MVSSVESLGDHVRRSSTESRLLRVHLTSRGALEQELEDLDLSSGGIKIFAPGVESMAMDEVAMFEWLLRIIDPGVDLLGEKGDVLGVLENGDTDRRFMSCDAAESLKHFVARDWNSAFGEESMRQKCGADTMRVEDGAHGRHALRDDAVQQGFRA